MGKLILQPAPTFQAPVRIPVPGADAATVVFTFKHRTRSELKAFVDGLANFANDAEMIQAIATAWDLTDVWTPDNVALLVESYVAAPGVILDVYLDQLARGREKNSAGPRAPST